jgi:HEAT repeat protein
MGGEGSFSARLIMRYWVTNWTVAIFVLVCGMSAGIVGCTKDPNNKDEDAKSIKTSTQVFAAKEIPAKKLPASNLDGNDPEEREVPSKDPSSQELPSQELPAKDFDAKDPNTNELPGKEFAAVELTPVLAQATKTKDKTKGKETTKEPAKESTKEPKYEFKEPSEVAGKTFQEWLKLMKETKDPVRREEAMKYITAFGPSKSHEALSEVIFQLNRHKTEPNGVDLSVRVNGIMALATIYRQMAMAKKDPPDKAHKDAFAVFRYFLNDGQVIMRVRTVQGLPSLGPIARDAIPDVIKLTKDGITWEVRKEALQTLTIIARDANGVPDPKVMPELRNRAKDISYVVRQTALEALAMLGAPKVPPELLKALNEDPVVQVRLKVLDLLGKLEKDMEDKDRKIALKTVNAHLSVEKDPILLIWTHGTIMTLMKKATSAHMYPVVNYVKDKDPAVRVQALTMIGLGGKDAKPFALKEVLEELHKCVPPENGKKFEYPDLNVAVTAMKAAVGIHAFEAVPVLEKIHNDKKAPEFLEVNAGKALDAFDQLKAHLEEKDKKDKDKDKKTPDKK